MQSLANVNIWFECRINIAANGTYFYWSSSMFVFLLHCCLWLFGKVHAFETDGRAKHLHGFSRRDRGIWEWDDLGAKTQLEKVLHPTGISHQKTHARVAPFGVRSSFEGFPLTSHHQLLAAHCIPNRWFNFQATNLLPTGCLRASCTFHLTRGLSPSAHLSSVCATEANVKIYYQLIPFRYLRGLIGRQAAVCG